ncbi:hypothetical protein [Bosea massiliensis]|uniref:Uncharacterized protein n=1 Tax=Bosea massiliensis TaxID=151419 RepID=A0ABW0PAP2_9HYPH
MLNLIWKRPDGTFVADVNGKPYHVVDGDEPLWTAALIAAAKLGNKLKLEPAPEAVDPPPLTRLAKADLWRRCTDEEAEVLHNALSQAPFRLRLIFEAAQYLDSTDPDYPALRAGVVAALGEVRAAIILSPEG